MLTKIMKKAPEPPALGRWSGRRARQIKLTLMVLPFRCRVLLFHYGARLGWVYAFVD